MGYNPFASDDPVSTAQNVLTGGATSFGGGMPNFGGMPNIGPYGGPNTGLPGLNSIFGGGSPFSTPDMSKLLPSTDFHPEAPIINAPAFNPANVAAPDINKVNFASAVFDKMHQPGVDLGAANAAGGAQNNFAQALQQRLGGALGGQNQLVGQLQQEAAGNGPGAQLAQQQANQLAQQNTQRMQGAIAGTRGINPALAARLVANQAGQANQAAAQQGAQMGLQQQLAARGQLGNIFGNESGLTTGATQNLLETGRTQDIQSALGAGQLSQAQLGTLVGGLGAQNQLISQGSLGAANINAANSRAGLQSQTGIAEAQGQAQTAANAQQTELEKATMAGKAGILGGLVNAGGGILGGLAAAGGGGSAAAGGGTAVETAGEAAPLVAASKGGKVPGNASVKGDSYKNDTVDAKLSPGEIVVPRTAADDPEKAHRFIDAIMAKHGKSKAGGYGGVLAARREVAKLKSRIADLESRIGGKAS